MITWLRYVPHAQVAKFKAKAKGWVLDDDLQGTSHGQWSVLMRWPFETEPVE